MSSSPSDDTSSDASVLQTMTLLATLSAAAELRHAFSERRAGRDPSMQETAGVVRPYLYVARRELQELVMRLRTGLAYAESNPEETPAALVRHFDYLMTVNRTRRLLQVIHQRLLSLYPDVSETLVEEARHLHKRCEALLKGEDAAFLEHLTSFLQRAPRFLVRLQRELAMF